MNRSSEMCGFIRILFVAGLLLCGNWIDIGWAKQRNHDKKIVCYMDISAVYRPGDGRFILDDLDPHLCSHLMYGFAHLEGNRIALADSPCGHSPKQGKAGGKPGGRESYIHLKKSNPKLNRLIVLGGGRGEDSGRYSAMARDPHARDEFVDSVVRFLVTHGFDGLDVNWTPNQPEDKDGFSALVRELRQELDGFKPGYVLTAAVSPDPGLYDVPVISQQLDFVTVKAFDLHMAGSESNSPTRHHSPMPSAREGVTSWLEAGLPKEKLVMGTALFGRGFILSNVESRGLQSPTVARIPMAPYTIQEGLWSYQEICERFRWELPQWRISIPPQVEAPFAYNGRYWLGYEDVESLHLKADYVRNMELGGIGVWSLDMDDFRGKCHDMKYILLKTIANAMEGGTMPEIPDRPQLDDGGEEQTTSEEASTGSSSTSPPVIEEDEGGEGQTTTDEGFTSTSPPLIEEDYMTSESSGENNTTTVAASPIEDVGDAEVTTTASGAATATTTTSSPKPSTTTQQPRPAMTTTTTRATPSTTRPTPTTTARPTTRPTGGGGGPSSTRPTQGTTRRTTTRPKGNNGGGRPSTTRRGSRPATTTRRRPSAEETQTDLVDFSDVTPNTL